MAGLSSTDNAVVDTSKLCSDKHLAKIAISISVDWREISPFLDLTAADEQEILGAIPPLSVRSQKIAMLRMWKKRQKANATYERLCQAFSDCEMTDLVDKTQNLLAVNSNSSSYYEEGPSSNLSSPDPIMISYTSYLKDLYTSMSHSHTSQHWAHLPQCEFVQLAMIKNEMVRRGGPEEELIRLAQQGKIETILSHKEPIDFADLFPFSPQSPTSGRVCLIEAAPGGGKSTLALHICRRWAQGASWLAQFDMVILVYLRDEAVQNASILAEILPACNTETSQNVASQLQDTVGKNVLFIFDGWDEFPQNLMKNTLVSTIIRQPHKLSLHQSTVLITSRPVATGNLLSIADRRVEILGFTQQQIHEYIVKALNGNSSHIQQLVQHLEEHPVIEGYCYIPLHSAILVHIFLTMKGALPTTHHELFCSLVLCCIVREQETHETETVLPEMSSLNDLPDDLKSKLNNLSLLAYNGIMEDKIVFYSEDLLTSNLPTNLPTLGLLQTTLGLTLCSKSLSYNFLHLSVQELLAAYHISQMDSSEQVKIFKKLFGSSRFQAVLQYYCGFTKLDNPEIRKFISSYQSNMNAVTQLLPLLHCFFEAKQPSLSQLINPTMFTCKGHFYPDDNYNTYPVLTTDPVDFLAIGYFIVTFLSTCGPEFIAPLYLKIRYFSTDHCIRLLLDELSKSPIEGLLAGALSDKLVLQLDRPSFAQLKCIASYLKRFPLICELELQRFDEVHVLSFVEEIILEVLHTNNFVTKLSLQYCPMPYQYDWSLTIKCAHLNKQLNELHLSSLPDAQLNCIFEHLQHNTTLVKLSLENCRITVENTGYLFKMLEANKSLTELNLSSLTDAQLNSIFEHLQHNTTLVKLSLSNCDTCITEETTKALFKMLEVNKSLTHLAFSHTMYLSDYEAVCVFKGLQHNTTLTNLDLSFCDICAIVPVITIPLFKMLQENNSVTHLNLSGNKFSDSGARCIFESLQHNSTLVYLNLGLTRIAATDPDTARALTKMLEVNKSLTYLDLSCEYPVQANRIISIIFSALEHNTTLLHLVLCGREISEDDAECVAQTLKSNHTLLTIDISTTYKGRSFMNIILPALKFNTTLKKLCIARYQVDEVAYQDSQNIKTRVLTISS